MSEVAGSLKFGGTNVDAERTFSQKSPILPQMFSATRCNKKVFG
ncbi:MAG TPA: hypothetical protein VIJ18_08255 [Microbacteriaceae bacterium]